MTARTGCRTCAEIIALPTVRAKLLFIQPVGEAAKRRDVRRLIAMIAENQRRMDLLQRLDLGYAAAENIYRLPDQLRGKS